MSDFIANSQMQNIVTENEVAVVLSHFSSDFVFSIVKNALENRFDVPPFIGPSNVVAAWEQNFKTIIARYDSSESTQQVTQVRNDTYREIIDIICKEFDLSFTISDNVDLYSAAFYLYDFFVCNFSTHLIDFFTNYIYRERNSLYESLGLSEVKKNKDSSTIYGKKIFKDIKLAIINANIDMVVGQIGSFDIPLTYIFNTAIQDKLVANYMCNLVSENTDFFKISYVRILLTNIRPAYITSIRFKLQEFSTGLESDAEPVVEEKTE